MFDTKIRNWAGISMGYFRAWIFVMGMGGHTLEQQTSLSGLSINYLLDSHVCCTA